MRTLQLSISSLCVLTVCQYAFADTITTSNTQDNTNITNSSITLDEIKVTDTNSGSDSVTKLGKVIKNSDKLNKQQVMGIRDLTRYDPGIYATEQGRGATTGYTIRGVDRNRVAITVDGISQAQSIGGDFGIFGKSPQNGSRNGFEGSGARNEIEFENISVVDITKGGSSAQNGSGALGGAVNFTTKNVDSVLTPNEKLGGRIKTGYSSKDGQFMQSGAVAFRHNGFEGMIQYTHRDGRETKAHKRAYSVTQEATRQGWYLHKYDLRKNTIYKKTPFGNAPIGSVDPSENTIYDKDNNPFYLMDCVKNCGPFYSAELTGDGPHTNLDRALTDEEQAQLDSTKHWKERLSAKDYTGPDRGVPDPKRFKTDSYLARLGYRPNDDHYIGLIFEDTTQKYRFRDMSVRAFYTPKEAQDASAGTILFPLRYYTSNPFEGVFPIGQWTKAAFSYETHHKTRQGLTYIYNGGAKWVDLLEVNADIQKVHLSSLYKILSCSAYPVVDENCTPSADKLGSRISVYNYDMEERHKRFNIKYNKDIKIFNTEHLFTLATGIDYFRSVHNREDYTYRFYRRNYTTQKINGKKYYKNLPATPQLIDKCNTSGHSHPSFCKNMIFKGKNHYLSLQDNIKLGELLDIGGTVRWDMDSIEGNQSFRPKTTYRNFSWSFGTVLHPFSFMDISYQASSGFRNPNVVEFFGPAVTNEHSEKLHNLNPEKSYNQEIGITFKNDWGHLEGSYFISKYRDLIGWGFRRNRIGRYTYHNLSNMKLVGASIQGYFVLNNIWNKIPEGLSLNLAYGWSKAKKNELVSGNLVGIASLDAIQPPRLVTGLSYDAPNQHWGISAIVTFSREKRFDELVYTDNFRYYKPKYDSNGKLIGREPRPLSYYNSTKDTSKSWTTLDLVGYVNLPHNITIRAGIYNVLNRQYSNWEAIRQAGVGSLHSHTGPAQKYDPQQGYKDPTQDINFSRYTAPGRNYTLNVEIKF